MKFDVVLTNPPFQDSTRRNTTPHKLWIDFTVAVFDRLLRDGGSLVQVSPASFSSPSNVVLTLMQEHQTKMLRFGTEHHFPSVASTFSDYWVVKAENTGPTTVVTAEERFDISLDRSVTYLPNDVGQLAMGVHKKVMFAGRPLLDVRWDYVTCHNSKRRGANPTVVTEQTSEHPHPLFHTNNIIWWSSVRQDWANQPKVMWTRSGYTKPFFDDGVLGGSDMAYYVPVADDAEGRILEANLNTEVMRYILRTAKWAGFASDRVFASLPDLPRARPLTDDEMNAHFNLTEQEVAHVRQSLAPRRRTAR
ncbi:hypothetical protein [Curtobacterium sp. MCBD17_040]|uniref:hypothetical protein n=1 Tax=Curtobacterium sp. MCBD17_040 TaxID=2175674 RepID=UPI000DA92862|nr:hypothetical protein [Curtobacterium sp. MCBD17_040]WIB65878.1 hypothetical protein DEI94_17335 [Curtobacterium sp. MCBD17_040]